jgi:outer membrane lipoprotein-sorting protein
MKGRVVRLLLLAAVCAMSIRFALAQSSQTAAPSVNQILANYVAAIGGRDAIAKITSRVSKGTIEVVGTPSAGTVESYAKAPNKYMSVITIPGYGEIRRCYTGTAAWVNGPETGFQDLSGQDLSSMQRSSDFYQVLDLAKLYPRLTLKDSQDVAGHLAYLIEADPGDGTLRRMYFDPASGLLVRSDEEQGPADTRQHTEINIGDYRQQDGIKYPLTIGEMTTTTDGQTKQTVTLIVRLTEVHHNVPIDDAIFAKPQK